MEEHRYLLGRSLYVRCSRGTPLCFLTRWDPALPCLLLGSLAQIPVCSEHLPDNAYLSGRPVLSSPFYRGEDWGPEQRHKIEAASPRLYPTNSRAELWSHSHLGTVSTLCYSCSRNSVHKMQRGQYPNVWPTRKGVLYVWPEYKVALSNSLKPRHRFHNRTSATQLNSGCAATHTCPVCFFLRGEAAPGILGTSCLNTGQYLLWR